MYSYSYNAIDDAYNSVRDYGPYILGAGIVLRLLFGRPKDSTGVMGTILFLSSWGMIIIGGIGTFLNINPFNIAIPKPGALIRGAAGPLAANMAVPYYPMPNVMQRPYTQIDRNIVTGKTQNGSLNPAYDKNTVFSVIGDVY